MQSFATSETEEFRSFFLTRLNGIGTVIFGVAGARRSRLRGIDGFPSGAVATTFGFPCASLAMMTTAGKLA
jgi:hypothetical protein